MMRYERLASKSLQNPSDWGMMGNDCLGEIVELHLVLTVSALRETIQVEKWRSRMLADIGGGSLRPQQDICIWDMPEPSLRLKCEREKRRVSC